MKIGIPERRRERGRRGEAVILFSVAGQRFAIAARAVDEIRAAEGLQALSASGFWAKAAKVRHFVQRERKTYYVVDANMHFRMLPSPQQRLLMLHDAPLAIAVEAIDRMAEINMLYALPRAFTGEERQWYRGLIVLHGEVVPVVNPAAFVSRGELAMLQARMAAPAENELRGAASL
jgi:chemotaxis signal transduction protein